MITPTMIYWANEADNIINFFAILTVIQATFLITWMVGCFFYYMAHTKDWWNFGVHDQKEGQKFADSHNKKIQSQIVRTSRKVILIIPFLLLSIIGGTLTPTTKTVYAMYIIPTVTNSKIAQQLPAQIEQYIQTALKEKAS